MPDAFFSQHLHSRNRRKALAAFAVRVKVEWLGLEPARCAYSKRGNSISAAFFEARLQKVECFELVYLQN